MALMHDTPTASLPAMPDLWFTVLANVPGALIGFSGVWVTQALGRRNENADARTEYLEGLIRDTEEIVVQLSGLVYAISHDATTGEVVPLPVELR